MRWGGFHNFYAEYQTLIFVSKQASPLWMLSWKISPDCAPWPCCAPETLNSGLASLGSCECKGWGWCWVSSAGGLQARREGRLLAATVRAFIQHLVSVPYLGSWGMALQGKPGEGNWVRCFQGCPGRGFFASCSACPTGVLTCTDPCSASESWAFWRVCWLLWDVNLLIYISLCAVGCRNTCHLWANIQHPPS